MAEYIDREAALAICEEEYREQIRILNYAGDSVAWNIGHAIKALPTEDAVPVVHGRWVPTKVPFMNECEDCSVCGYRTVWGRRFNYCPNCGAKMDEKEDVYD